MKKLISIVCLLSLLVTLNGCKGGIDGDNDCNKEPDAPNGYWRDYEYQTDGCRWYTNGTNWILYTRDSDGCWN